MNTHNEIMFEVVASQNLSASVREEILHLCSDAYEEDFRPYLDVLQNPVHLLARRSGVPVSHAAWVTRWLQVNAEIMLRTAYVEAVATAPAHQHQGLASAVMTQLVTHLSDFDIAALSPSDAGFYARFGWELWRGQLAVRTEQALVATPDEEVMIYRLPRTPELDLNHLLTIEWRPGDEVWQ
jgi:aminoglycoside 2'-N-acetyltransferase I